MEPVDVGVEVAVGVGAAPGSWAKSHVQADPAETDSQKACGP